MPPRRSHRKSRNGCDRCKRRRIKCDESGPPCGYCASRQAECHYSGLFRNFALGASLPEQARGEFIKDHHIVPGTTSPTGSTRMRELELMHRWCTKTCHSFSPSLSGLFQEYVVTEALKHHYLMESVLALTSLHIASEVDRPVSAVDESLRYQETAVPAFRAELGCVTASNCNALFASSVILMACTVASAFIGGKTGDLPKSASRDLLLLLPFVKGVHYVITRGQEWLLNGPFRDIIRIHPEGEYLIDNGMIPPIQHLQTLYSDLDPDLRGVYDKATRLLGNCFLKDKNMAIAWMLMVGDSFMDQLQQEDPMALLIYMYWGVLLHQLDGVWWAQISGKGLVQELCVRLAGRGDSWDKAILWARRQIGL